MKDNIFGKNLRQMRLNEHISQNKLGVYLGVSNQLVSFWESGKREPDMDMIIKISEFFQCTIDELLK